MWFWRRRLTDPADLPGETADEPFLDTSALQPPPQGSSEPETPAATPEASAPSDDASTDAPFVADPDRTHSLAPKIVDAISTVYDPEIPVNIYELGLVYGIEVDAQGHAHIEMTLTSPMCPSAQQLPAEVQQKVSAVEGVESASVDIVWEPPWSMEKMSEAARLQLGIL